jgi:hypothetical protein
MPILRVREDAKRRDGMVILLEGEEQVWSPTGRSP